MPTLTHPLQFTPQSRPRHRYQMIPSKNGNIVATSSPTGSAVDERYEAFDGAQDRERLSWKKQAIVDLKPSLHRDTYEVTAKILQQMY